MVIRRPHTALFRSLGPRTRSRSIFSPLPVPPVRWSTAILSSNRSCQLDIDESRRGIQLVAEISLVTVERHCNLKSARQTLLPTSPSISHINATPRIKRVVFVRLLVAWEAALFVFASLHIIAERLNHCL
jgi:hypothetical protein